MKRGKPKKKKFAQKKEKIKKVVKNISFWHRVKNIEEKHTLLFFLIVGILLVIFLVFGTRLYLFFNFILGHDTIVQLTADNQDFFMKNLETGEVEFDVYVSTNFFCEASCDYSFEDISSGYIIDKNNFTTKISNPGKFKYSLVAPEIGEGQKLYRFYVECSSHKTSFCRTDEEEKKRSYLVALNYELSPEQALFRERANDSLKQLIFENDELNRINLENIEMHKILSEYILLDNLTQDNLTYIGKELDLLIEEWKNYRYEEVLGDLLFEKMNETRNLFVEENYNLSSLFIDFNYLVFDLENIRKEIYGLTLIENVSEEDYIKISSLVNEYNSFVNLTSSLFKLGLANNTANYFYYSINETIENLNLTGNVTYNYTEIDTPKIGVISKPFYSNYSSGREVITEEPMCCYKGDCDVCCSNDCHDDQDKYPIILVHGHSFNDAVSAESSIGDLNSIKEKLIDDGLIDGGYVIVRKLNRTGTFARTNKQMVFSVSYYFDIYQNDEETFVLQTKADSLDTYALRLNDIIENVKLMTNRDKVNIVAHSMGGLVSRRYMQIFGDDSVNDLIMIGTPNHGIDGYVLSSCPVFGADIHCEAMDKSSLFLNKLNYGKVPETNVSVIIGVGCNTDGSVGDGIVKNESAYLSWAKDYYVNGTCSGVNFLHQTILDVDKYPEVYRIIKNELNI